MIEVSVQDNITPFISEWLAKMPTWRKRLSRALGWYSQKRIKELSNSGAVTSGYEARTPYWVRKALAHGKNPPHDNVWWGKLRRAVGYQADDGVTLIGWTSRSSSAEGRVQEEGTTRQVTPALRRYYAAVGVKLGGKSTITLPARPLFEPSMRITKPEFGAFMTKKVSEYVQGITHTGIRKSNRKYKVY